MERAADIFGQVWRSGDIRLPGPEPLPGTREENRWYTRAQPDGDGVFRRVAPALNDENATEHIAFAAFKRQFRTVNFVTGAEARNGSGAPAAPRLILAREGEERIIPLDMAGRVLFRKPLDVPEVQRIALQSFLDYERVDEELARLLQTAETRGYFAYLDPESYPSILYRYSQALREDMLENPGDEKKLRWLDFRGRYIRSLETLLNGPSETLLVSGYETLIARERLGRAGIDRIIGMRDEVIVTFARIREHYGEFSDLRSAFSTALSGASCIMGTVSRPTFPHPAGSQWGEKFFPPRRSNPTDAEVSAILANTLLTGSAVTPAGFNTLWPWCLGISGIVLFIIMKSSPVFTFVTGLILMLLEGTVFAFGFVFTAYWIDPLLPALTLAAGIAASGITAASMKSRSARRFRMAYRSHIAPHYLKQVIRMESPRPEETRLVKAAIIAVRWPDLRLREMRDPPGTSADELRAFREAVFRHFTRTGGVFLGAEGDLALIAYGSPLERICLNSLRAEMPYEDEAQARSNHSPAAKAVGAVLDLIAGGRRAGPAVAEPWTFGIDSGECVFGWAEQGGYTAFGPPVIRARTLASLTSRYQARILVSAGVIEKTEGVLSKKIDVLRDREGTTQEAFYRLITEPAAIPGK
jgi:class 3 adenylate cyclase